MKRNPNENSDRNSQKLRKLFSSVGMMVLIIMLSFSAVFAQQGKTIKGTVTDNTNLPLPGVTISVKGAPVGTITSSDGTYSIVVPATGKVLAFSFVGMKSMEVTIGNQTQINVTMTEESIGLDEVVAVGYGTQKKVSLTGSVGTVNSQTFQDRGPVASPLAALQGQVAGVTVTRSSGQPGRESWNFMIRGNSSVNGAEPLVIVDGLTLPNASALNSFNPNDIENISFLKDAAATSIYGARAAGGVVIITTKRAKSGAAVVEYNGSVSRKQIGLQPNLVDINGWGPMMAEARMGDGFDNTDIWNRYFLLSQHAVKNNIQWMSSAEAASNLATLGLVTTGFFTDVKDFVFFPGTMQDYLWNNSTSTEHQLSISNKGEKSGYRISFGYLDDGSLLEVGNNSNKRYNVRLTHDYQFTPKLKLESNVSFERNDIVQPSNIGAVLNNGIQPGLPASGLGLTGKAYVWGSGIGNASTVSIANFGGVSKEANTRLNTNFNLTYNVTKDLKAVASAGYYLHDADYRTKENSIPWYDYSGTALISSLSPSGSGRSFYQRANRKESYYNFNAYLEYSKTLNTDHDVKVMVGTQYERQEFNSFFAKTFDIVPGVSPSLSLSYGDAASKSVAESQNHYALAGYFGRLNYAFKNKYLLEVNSRYDGSSKFDIDNRWKYFYGFSGGWRVTEEKFMENFKFLSDLKLRASLGNVGNQSGIGLYDYITLLNLSYSTGATSSGFPILGTNPAVRVTPGNLVALDRSWERIQTINYGVDFGVLDNRLKGSAEYFVKNNNNMLIARTYPAVLGANAPAGNNGELETNGWEFSLNWSDKINKFSYHFGGNLSTYETNLKNFGGQTIINSTNRGLNSAVEGYPINTYFGLVYAGRIQTQAELDEYRKFIVGNNIGMPSGAATAQANARLALGDNMYKDISGPNGVPDGKITFPEDAIDLGSSDPKLTYSVNAGFEWKGFDFNMMLQGVGKRTIIRDGNWRVPAQVIYQAQNGAFVDKWWTPSRTDAELPRISTTGTINNYNYFPSDWVAENGAFLRLKNVVLGYTLPKSVSRLAKMEKVRVYFSGNDLWEISHIKDGWDPEATNNIANTGDSNNNNQSTFSGRYPFYRLLSFGVNLTF
ncbi:MAG: TonB-dependent receptor [Bacteroidota bacterium]|nr:TonB-dependent receptor [Bacteroidota bacterium]